MFPPPLGERNRVRGKRSLTLNLITENSIVKGVKKIEGGPFLLSKRMLN
jgi:hypothetical protein